MPTIRNDVLKESAFETAADWSVSHGRRFRANIIIWGMRKHYSTRLFMLAKCVLASPATGHRLRWREILKRVKSRLQRWADGDLMSLWSEALDDGRSLAKRRHQSASASSSGNFWRAKLAVQDGQYTKAIRALTSEGLASPSPEVLQEMQNKHPQAPPLTCHPAQSPLLLHSRSLPSSRG